MKDKLLATFRRMLAPRPPKQIRFIDTCGNTLFLLPDGGSIVMTYASGEQLVKVCRYVDGNQAEIDGTECYLTAFAEECQRAGVSFAPEPAPEYYENYRIVRKMPVPGNIIALGRDLGNFYSYVMLERPQGRDGYDCPSRFTEGWKAHEAYERRVWELRRGATATTGPCRLRKRGDSGEA